MKPSPILSSPSNSGLLVSQLCYGWVKKGQKSVKKVNLMLTITVKVVPALHLPLPPQQHSHPQ